MPPSEAADLCRFAFWVVISLQAAFVGVALDLNELSFSLFKVMGNKRSAAAAALIDSSKSLEAFKSNLINHDLLGFCNTAKPYFHGGHLS